MHGWMRDGPANPQVSNDSKCRTGTSICCLIPSIANYGSSGSFASGVSFLFVLEAQSGSIVTKHNSPASMLPYVLFLYGVARQARALGSDQCFKWLHFIMQDVVKSLKIIQVRQISTRSFSYVC